MNRRCVVPAILIAALIFLARKFWPLFALPSMTSVVVVADFVIGRFSASQLLRTEDRTVLFPLLAACGMAVLLTAGYVSSFDVHNAGYSPWAAPALALVGILLTHRAGRAAWTILLILLAFDLHLLPTHNLIDYLVDPLLTIGTIVWCLLRALERKAVTEQGA